MVVDDYLSAFLDESKEILIKHHDLVANCPIFHYVGLEF
jgi:hypothetical protein